MDKITSSDEPRRRPSKRSAFGMTFDRQAIPGVKYVIAVGSGKGGVGKSTVSVNIATALKDAGYKVGILDADVYGPSIPLMFGVKGPVQLSDQGKVIPVEKFGIHIMSFGFLSDAEHPVIWRGPLVAKAMEQLCFDVCWPDLDYLVIDLPPGTGDIALTMVEKVAVSGAVIVTTPQIISLLDAQKALTMFRDLELPVIGVVENMVSVTCKKCGETNAVFEDGGAQHIAERYHTQVLARLALDKPISTACDKGELALHAQDVGSGWKGAFASVAKQISDRLPVVTLKN